MLYKYPQETYPYEQMVRESQNRSRDVAEFEITDTDLFDDNKYWDVFVEVSLPIQKKMQVQFDSARDEPLTFRLSLSFSQSILNLQSLPPMFTVR